MGIVLIFIGFAGKAFTIQAQDEMSVGDTLQVGAYSFRLADMQSSDSPNYATQKAAVEVSKHGRPLETMHPERRFYHASQQPTSEVSIRPRLNEDVYVVFAGVSNEQKPVLQVFINPLVNWIWIGTLVVVLGTLIALIPSKVKLAYPRMQVVGTTKKHEVVPQD
jgi:cytochrome c-type biogenesis protein CcmF